MKPVAEKAQVSVDYIKTMYTHLAEDLKEIRQASAKPANRKRSKGPALIEGGMVYLLRKNIRIKRPSEKLDHTKLGPFRIQKKLSKVIYQLSLPKTIKIHPVFYISLLEPALEKAK